MKKIILLGSSLLLALTLAGCANSSSKTAHKDSSSKIEKTVSHKQSEYFKNDAIKTKDLSLTINQKDVIKFNNDREDLRLLFTIKNDSNSAINNLMNNKIIKASQEINNKEVQLPVVDESMNDSTIEKTNKNDHVEAQSTTQSVMYFKVKDVNQPVILTAYDNHGKKIGTETIQLGRIKTINLNSQNSSMQQ